MDSVIAFIIYLTLFRLAIITAGVVSIVLGYRLFCKGIWSAAGSGKGTSVDAEFAGSHFTLKNAAPGTCFALFGVIIISVMFATGSPEMTLDLMNSAAQIEPAVEDNGITDQLSLKLRGAAKEGLAEATQKGIYFEERKDTAKAIAEYKKAIAMMAAPMNHLAWLYQGRGEFDKALPLSRLAVALSPDNADFIDTLAEILFKTGEHSEALSLMEKVAGLNTKYSKKLERFREAVK